MGMEIQLCAGLGAIRRFKIGNLGSKFASTPCSLSGVKLDGENLVRFVYVDESGISVNENTLVVAGVIIDADSQWSRVAQHLDQLVNEFVPHGQRNGFIFHATEFFTGPDQYLRGANTLLNARTKR